MIDEIRETRMSVINYYMTSGNKETTEEIQQ